MEYTHHHHHHHHHHQHDYSSKERFEDRWDHEDYRNRKSSSASQRARFSSVIALFFSFIGALTLFLAYLISDAAKMEMNQYFVWGATALALLAFPFGFYAAIVQLRYRSAGIGTRLLVIMFFIFSVLFYQGRKLLHEYDVFEREDQEIADTGAQEGEGAEKNVVSAQKTDTSIFKPGWYGEKTERGVTLIFASFFPNAIESKTFNKRLTKPVSYATLSVMNLSRQPFEILSVVLNLRLKDGTFVKTMPVADLLSADPVQNADLIKFLEVPKVVDSGKMFAPVPVCMPADFDWNDVDSVGLEASGGTVMINGRMLTAKEKEALLSNQNDEKKEKEEVPVKSQSEEKGKKSPMEYYNNL